MKTYNVMPATDKQVSAFYKKQNDNAIEWSSVLLANILQVTNGKSNTQQINKSLNLETTCFKNGNLKQQGQVILAYLKHVIEAHNIGVKWNNERFQYVESVALDIETVQPFHLWQAEAEAKAEADKAKADKARAEAEAESNRLKEEKAAALAAKKAAEKIAEKAKKAAEKASQLAETASTKEEAEEAKQLEADAIALAKVEAEKATKLEAEAKGLDQAIKAERDRLLAAGGGVKAASLLGQLERALLAGITGGNVTQLQAIAKAAGELQLMAAGLAMEESAKVDSAAALQLADVPPSSASRSAGLKRVG